MFLDGYMNHIYNAFLPHIACCCCCSCHPFSQSHYILMCAWYGLATIRSCTSRRVVGPGRIRYLFYSLCKDQITNQPSHPIPSTIISLTEEGWNCVLLMVVPRQTYVGTRYNRHRICQPLLDDGHRVAGFPSHRRRAVHEHTLQIAFPLITLCERPATEDVILSNS